jgi:hypothetical protein
VQSLQSLPADHEDRKTYEARRRVVSEVKTSFEKLAPLTTWQLAKWWKKMPEKGVVAASCRCCSAHLGCFCGCCSVSSSASSGPSSSGSAALASSGASPASEPSEPRPPLLDWTRFRTTEEGGDEEKEEKEGSGEVSGDSLYKEGSSEVEVDNEKKKDDSIKKKNYGEKKKKTDDDRYDIRNRRLRPDELNRMVATADRWDADFDMVMMQCSNKFSSDDSPLQRAKDAPIFRGMQSPRVLGGHIGYHRPGKAIIVSKACRSRLFEGAIGVCITKQVLKNRKNYV